jgi:hypothetical protein
MGSGIAELLAGHKIDYPSESQRIEKTFARPEAKRQRKKSDPNQPELA